MSVETQAYPSLEIANKDYSHFFKDDEFKQAYDDIQASVTSPSEMMDMFSNGVGMQGFMAIMMFAYESQNAQMRETSLVLHHMAQNMEELNQAKANAEEFFNALEFGGTSGYEGTYKANADDTVTINGETFVAVTNKNDDVFYVHQDAVVDGHFVHDGTEASGALVPKGVVDAELETSNLDGRSINLPGIVFATNEDGSKTGGLVLGDTSTRGAFNGFKDSLMGEHGFFDRNLSTAITDIESVTAEANYLKTLVESTNLMFTKAVGSSKTLGNRAMS